MVLRVILFLFFSMQAYAMGEYIHFCVTKKDTNLTIVCEERYSYSKETSIAKTIEEIQKKLRYTITKAKETKKKFSLVLYAKGFEGTLLSIAQTNLLPYYREYIQGIILEDVPSDLDTWCNFKSKSIHPIQECEKIKDFRHTLKEKASLAELSHALSPSLQVDWYWPSVLLLSKDKNLQYKKWIKALEENDINYFEGDTSDNILNYKEKFTYFYQSIKPHYIKTKNRKKSTYYGPLLRFHLSKILYAPVREVSVRKNVHYGKSKAQSYDVFMDNNRSGHPLMIYLHGGGWNKGDKSNFSDFCKQYANRGYTAIAVNYRLLNLPSVGMKEMVSDVKHALEQILQHKEKYHAKGTPVVVMGESAGAQLLFTALSKIPEKKVNVAILNSITADLHKHSEKKQIRLSGIKDKAKRKAWLNSYSPLANLNTYKTATLAIHSLDDAVVPASHLKALDLQSVIHHQNIKTLWVTGAQHPISPSYHTMQPGYADIERTINLFLLNHF